MKPKLSATRPCKSGSMPPPHTIIMKMPDAAAVCLPKPSTARLKIAPHITDVQSPQSIKSSIFTGTSAMPKDISYLNTGIFTIV